MVKTTNQYNILYIPRFVPLLLTKAFLRLLVYELPEAVLAPLRGEGPQRDQGTVSME